MITAIEMEQKKKDAIHKELLAEVNRKLWYLRGCAEDASKENYVNFERWTKQIRITLSDIEQLYAEAQQYKKGAPHED